MARSHAYEAPKPGSVGRNWDEIGWRVDVVFQEVATSFRPSDWMEMLRPLLPEKYSPLLPDGRGSQSIYLTELPRPLALQLAELVSREVAALARAEVVREHEVAVPNPEMVLWEEHLRSVIESDPRIGATEKQSLVLARRGQGVFRERVQRIEASCRVTRVDRPEHLRASHCKRRPSAPTGTTRRARAPRPRDPRRRSR